MHVDRATREAFMTKAEFDSLLEYSSSMPTGQTPGKVWKSLLRNGDWVMREYELYPEGHPQRDTHVKINCFDICIKVPGVSYA